MRQVQGDAQTWQLRPEIRSRQRQKCPPKKASRRTHAQQPAAQIHRDGHALRVFSASHLAWPSPPHCPRWVSCQPPARPSPGPREQTSGGNPDSGAASKDFSPPAPPLFLSNSSFLPGCTSICARLADGERSPLDSNQRQLVSAEPLSLILKGVSRILHLLGTSEVNPTETSHLISALLSSRPTGTS